MALSKVRGYSFHPWAVCITTGCPWEMNSSGATRDLAKQHARNRGHHVQIVQETHDHWAPDGYDFGAQDKTDEEMDVLDAKGNRRA